MEVEIPLQIRAAASEFGAGVPYALKVLAGQLADDPDTGQPSGEPDVLAVTVDGDLFEDCPTLTVGYVCEADRIRVQYVNAVPAAAPTSHTRDRPPQAANEVMAREVEDAWRRVAGWLQDHAPDSFNALRAGANDTTVAALGHDLGIQIPADLRALWSLAAGDDGVDGAGCLPGNQALMPLDTVATFYGQQMDSQTHQDSLNSHRPEPDRITVWKSTWIPVLSYGVTDRTSGLYLDAATGYLGRWSRYNEDSGDEIDTLATYLEDVADMLETPALSTRDKPGLVDGVLVWGSRLDPAQEESWRPLA
ncbi:hypothetical protein AB0L71_22340 [Streptomyces sp. NPDC052052]|uniref:hypothetical protein n=1 Tax=Streptomyces sp. NPDC052052 TaxID=3154756 RepID=UPI003422272E